MTRLQVQLLGYPWSATGSRGLVGRTVEGASSPGAIGGVLDVLRDTDVRQLLARVATPTLVLHRSGDRAVRIEAGRFLAERIRGALPIELPGNDHWFWAGDQQPLIRSIGELIGRSR
jgi:pimeloyl-ACP methyl ester carboxylesterase